MKSIFTFFLKGVRLLTEKTNNIGILTQRLNLGKDSINMPMMLLTSPMKINSLYLGSN